MDNRWLLQHKKNITSQRGEDGVLAKIFDVLGITTGWCVDVGAYGKNLSNTYTLIDNGWSGVLFEANEGRLRILEKQHRRAGHNTYCLHAHIEPVGDESLDNLLAKTPLPQNFALLSIDIDGNDYYIWESLKNYTPAVVIIEFTSLLKFADYLQPVNGRGGASLTVMVDLGKTKGYELIAATSFNAIFVKKELFGQFMIEDNSPQSLWLPDQYDEYYLDRFAKKTGLGPNTAVTKIFNSPKGRDQAVCVLENGLPVLVNDWERISGKKII